MNFNNKTREDLIQELAALRFIAAHPKRYHLRWPEDIPYKISPSTLLDNGYHFILGLNAPSSARISLPKFYEIAKSLEYISEEGELLNPDMAVPTPKYQQNHLESGIWYAWTDEAISNIKEAYKNLPKPEETPYPPGAGDLM